MKDLQELQKSPLEEHGIYTSSNEENMFELYVMMIGPKDTPYEDGFFFFTVTFPKDTYPSQPPTVQFYGMNSTTRFNPNLYTNGKVCLSIINTWSGPGWTSCNTVSTVLLSIQAMVLNEEPLRNEPGYETAPKQTIQDYSMIIEHETIRLAILENLKKLPDVYEVFRPILEEHFMKQFIHLLKKIQHKIDHPPIYDEKAVIWNRSIQAPVYRFPVNLNYPKYKNELEKYYFDILCPKYENGTLKHEMKKNQIEWTTIINKESKKQDEILSIQKMIRPDYQKTKHKDSISIETILQDPFFHAVLPTHKDTWIQMEKKWLEFKQYCQSNANSTWIDTFSKMVQRQYFYMKMIYLTQTPTYQSKLQSDFLPLLVPKKKEKKEKKEKEDETLPSSPPTPSQLKSASKAYLVEVCKTFFPQISIVHLVPISKNNPILKEKEKNKDLLLNEYRDLWNQSKQIVTI